MCILLVWTDTNVELVELIQKRKNGIAIQKDRVLDHSVTNFLCVSNKSLWTWVVPICKMKELPKELMNFPWSL